MASRGYAFGPYRLLPARRELLRTGAPVALTPKAFDALVILVEHRDRVVSKSELMDALWPETAVEEAGLTQLVFLIRRLLGHGDESERFIATVPRRGYRFVADVEVVGEAPAGLPASTPPTRRRARAAVWVGLVVLAVMIGSLVFVVRRGSGPVAQAAATFLKLTSSEALSLSPSLSPDEKWVAYSATNSSRTDPDQIYLQSVGGLAPVCLTCGTAGRKTAPVFSPDGGQIAFAVGTRFGGIFVMGRDGDSPRRLTERGFQPAWSPEGGRIVYATTATDFIPVEGYASTSELWIVDVRSGEARQLELADGRDPAWSPDGQWIAFWTPGTSSASRDIFLIPAAGGTPRRVTTGATSWNPTWAADGRALFFLSNRAGPRGLWRVPIELSSGRVTGPAEPVTLPTAFVTYPRTGPNDSVVYSDARATSNVSLLSFDPATSTITGPLQTVTSGNRFWLPPHPSPGGRWLALAQAAISDAEDIFAIERDGTRLRRLTDDRSTIAIRRCRPTAASSLFHRIVAGVGVSG